MLTILTTAKPFRGHDRIAQINALRSWTLLEPRPEILLFGDDEGCAEIAAELGIRHIPNVPLAPSGVPELSAMCELGERLTTNPLLCINGADCIFMSDFMHAVAMVARLRRPFLMQGRFWDVEIPEPISFDADWAARLRRYVSERTTFRGWAGSAYFVYPRGFFADVPSITHGSNNAMDNWLVYYARSRGAMVVDGSYAATVIHQRHTRSGIAHRQQMVDDARRAGLHRHWFNIGDSTHVVTKRGVRPALAPYYVWRRSYNLAVFYPWLMPLRRCVESVMARTRPLRIRFGWELTGYGRK